MSTRTLAAGYAAQPSTDVRRISRLAETYQPNERGEALLRLKREQPAVFASLPATQRMAAASYEAAKAAHQAHQQQKETQE